MSDSAGITCEGLEWLGDVPIFYSSIVVVLALNNSKREDLVQVWECLCVSRLAWSGNGGP